MSELTTPETSPKSTEERVREIIDQLRPFIQMDGGDVEYLGMGDDKIVNVRLQGACTTCSSSIITLKQGLEARIREECPEVVAVEAI